MKKMKIVIGILTCMLLVIACKKEQGNAYMSVRMTDAPGNYDNVFVDIAGIQVHVSGNNGGPSGWQMLNIIPGTYDLLELQNGIDTVLAPLQTIPAGTVSQIRLILGNNNYVVQNGMSIPLSVPSGSESGLKINLHDQVAPNQNYVVLLDFDADKSIVANGDGSLHLKPVIKKL